MGGSHAGDGRGDEGVGSEIGEFNYELRITGIANYGNYELRYGGQVSYLSYSFKRLWH